MATKSILKNITIKEKVTSRSLINALENADKKKTKNFTFSRGVRVADKELIKKLFGEEKNDGIS